MKAKGLLLLAALAAPAASTSDKVVVTATQTLPSARPGEVIIVPWAEVFICHGIGTLVRVFHRFLAFAVVISAP
jgi:hypothetical protein